MGLINVIVILAIIGTAWWLFNAYVPAPAPVKTVGGIVVAVIMIVILLQVLLGGGGMHSIRL